MKIHYQNPKNGKIICNNPRFEYKRPESITDQKKLVTCADCLRTHITIEDVMSSINKTDRCWLWTGNINEIGYGHFTLDRKMWTAHRFFFQLHKGPIPKGLCVCHTCDVRSCINPDHLYAGTKADNSGDAWRRGRGVSPFIAGEKHCRAKLTQKQVLDIRHSYAGGIRIAELFKKYGTSEANISQIVHRKSWVHI